MGEGGLGTAIGGKIIGSYSLERLYLVYGLALLVTWLLSYALIRDRSSRRIARFWYVLMIRDYRVSFLGVHVIAHHIKLPNYNIKSRGLT